MELENIVQLVAQIWIIMIAQIWIFRFHWSFMYSLAALCHAIIAPELVLFLLAYFCGVSGLGCM